MSEKRVEYVLNTSWRRVNKNELTWWYVLETAWRCLENIFARRIKDVLKTSWRLVLKTFLQNALKTSWRRLENVSKTFWRRMTKTNIFVLIKTSWKCLHQDHCLLGLNNESSNPDINFLNKTFGVVDSPYFSLEEIPCKV